MRKRSDACWLSTSTTILLRFFSSNWQRQRCWSNLRFGWPKVCTQLYCIVLYYIVSIDLIFVVLFRLSLLFCSKKHGWAPKLSFRYFNVNLNNSYKYFEILHRLHSPHFKKPTMPEAVREAAHAMLQKGETMRKLAPIHPPFKRDLTNAFDTSVRNFRSDVKGFVAHR